MDKVVRELGTKVKKGDIVTVEGNQSLVKIKYIMFFINQKVVFVL